MRYERAINMNRRQERLPNVPKKKPQPATPKKKRELLIIMCSERQLNGIKAEEINQLKSKYQGLKIRFRTYANNLEIGDCQTVNDMVPTLGALRKKPKFLAFSFDPCLVRYNINGTAENNYAQKMNEIRQKIVTICPAEQQANVRNANDQTLIALFNQMTITDDQRRNIGPLPDMGILKSYAQRDAEWSHMLVFFRLVRSAVDSPDLRTSKIGVIVDRTKALDLVAPLWRAVSSEAFNGKLNVMHTSQRERDGAHVGEEHGQSEIHFYAHRIAGVLSGFNAVCADGVRRGLISTTDSDTDG